MYIPDAFAVTDPAEIAALLGGARLAVLVTHGAEGLFATHLPLIHDAAAGTLNGHMARTNPHRARAGDGEALVIVQGVEAYVSPSFYPAKAEHGRVVPTWNYEVVHVHGRLTWHEEADWLHANVAALTDRFEAGREPPWALADAPESYVAGMLRAIVGVELAITRVEAKRKLSQNRGEADRAGVIEGLAASPREGDRAVAAAMAALAG